jgi:hypothetical protein
MQDKSCCVVSVLVVDRCSVRHVHVHELPNQYIVTLSDDLAT